MAFNWVCPYCNVAQAVVPQRHSLSTTPFHMEGLAEGDLALERETTVCANPDCRRTTIHIRIGNYNAYRAPNMGTRYEMSGGGIVFDDTVAPRSSAKPQPTYIPTPLVEDYTEACLIKNLSPKASATLARRCLQGMIRDFAKISKARLIDEIKALKAAVEDGTADRAVTSESVAAIDHVRGLGNIGAHMEADIDVIVPVDAGEAQAMIDLIEMLFDEWYGARERRNQRLTKIEQIRASKDDIKREAIAGKAEATAAGVEGGASALLDE